MGLTLILKIREGLELYLFIAFNIQLPGKDVSSPDIERVPVIDWHQKLLLANL